MIGDVPAAGPHGGDGAAIARWLGVPVEQVLDLSASLNPVAPDVEALVVRHAAAARRYGDVAPAEERLAARLGVDPDLLVLTAGASQAIALVAWARPDGHVVEPEFSGYRRHLRSVDPGSPRWRSNPHSPSGRLARPDDLASVWDEAYWPLATGTWTRGDHRNGAVVIGSLTKLLACPGLRLGYVLAPDVSTAEQLRALRPEWAVGALALEVADDALDALDLADTARRVAAARTALATAVAAHGWDVDAADAPWILVRGAAGLRATLARRAVVVRDCTSFGWPDTVRIGIPGPADLDRFLSALPPREDP
ncbi:aminotransferase class I/II-fold pyridoxal phosphate-dependent enzyme [Actinomarinicola tropica]|uniref:histidinol-phosphate transaminase n=1 Tax=Actinomarinicola tropica TaxID=2789776 RepID=A0A5Q2RHK9_9ACTN|nr:aminotransferase class I/II-fold pyridoxal phosphate-dependent enzyme [Actinomarinicola tropica]QGG95263.1 aminotransferase class I/II-fold pyridoxal phosphate-dependent enzyme [Actinomarinicola tropica]